MSSPVTPTRPAWAGPTAPPWSVLALLPDAFADWYKNYYAYATSYLTLALSAAQTNNIAIQNDAYFVLLAATMVETAVGDLTLFTYRPITVQIFDSSAGANMFSQPIMADEFFGDAQQPGFLAFPYIFQPGGNIAITLTNLEATARNVRVTLHGFKCNPRLRENDVYATPSNRY
jgi:hypothetical protein